MFPPSIEQLTEALSRLPDIGPRAARRLTFHFLNQDQSELDKLAHLLKALKSKIRLCSRCFNLSSANQLCAICQNSQRDQQTVCLVETPLSILSIEKTGRYQGVYHVLGGLISPGNGLGPDQLKIKELVARVKKSQPPIKEIIFALSPTTEGDTTVFYLERLLRPLGVKMTRLARGLASGTDLEYADENTLTNALLGRR